MLPFLGALTTSSGPSESIFLFEFLHGNDLITHIESLPDRRLAIADAKCIFRQMVAVVAQCHERGVAHRDLKLENFVVSPSEAGPVVTLCDFDQAVLFDSSTRLREQCGTLPYCSPAIVSSVPYHRTFPASMLLRRTLIGIAVAFFLLAAVEDAWALGIWYVVISVSLSLVALSFFRSGGPALRWAFRFQERIDLLLPRSRFYLQSS